MILEKIRQLLKPRWRRVTLEILVFLLLYLALRTWMQRDLPAGPAPVLQGVTLTGQALDLATLGQGRPVLVHFWATWCPICKLEQGAINALSADYPVITIATQSGDAQAVQAFLQEQQLHFPVLMDEDGALLQRFGLHGVPATFVIDPHGKIAFREVGYTTGWGLRARLWLAR
jgi:thiol-disulfide isomerase/thioredoxin